MVSIGSVLARLAGRQAGPQKIAIADPPARTAIETRRVLQPPFVHRGGCCWTFPLDEGGDDVTDPRRSALTLFEDGRELGPAHSSHSEIEVIGGGRYAHWEKTLTFSASDNSDPNSNGRHYEIEISAARYFERWARISASIAAFYVDSLGGPETFRGRRVLEIGPGREMGAALLMAGLGAKVVCLENHHRGWQPEWHAPFVERLLRLVPSLPFPIDETPLRRSLEIGAFDTAILTLLDIALEDLPDSYAGFADIFVSHSVFEHFEDSAAAMAKLRMACAPGAVGAHRVDFRDHHENQKPLEFLLLGDREYDADCGAYRYGRGNRMRLHEYRRLLESLFDEMSFMQELAIDEQYLSDFLPRLRASGTRFADLAKDDLRALGGVFILRCRG